MQYQHHRAGSRRGYMHLVFDLYGVDAARDLGRKFRLHPATISNWISTWTRAQRYGRSWNASRGR